MRPDPYDRHDTPMRPDRRRGARVVCGVRMRVGIAEVRARDGWMDWTPEARERVLRVAAAEYATRDVTLASLERAHGIPRDLLSRHVATGHAALLALHRTERLRRATHEVGRLGHAISSVCRRWCVPPEEVAPRAERLRADALRLLNRSDARSR